MHKWDMPTVYPCNNKSATDTFKHNHSATLYNKSMIYKILICIAIIYCILLIAAWCMQTSLIFHPGKLPQKFRFPLPHNGREISLTTTDSQTINALFFQGRKDDVILYFHGNAGDLSGWQHIAGDFTSLGYSVFIIDYRGYGKSSGTISEKGLYKDADAAYQYLLQNGFTPQHIIIYGRSIGTGVATDLASRHHTRGLILEAPYTSLKDLATQKLPLLLPALILRYRFNNISKIQEVKSPIIFFHGADDSLIPPSHTNALYDRFTGQKKKIIIARATHNDVNEFPEYHAVLQNTLPEFFR